MILKVIAAIFAAYEFYKMLNADAFNELIKRTKTADRLEMVPEILSDPFCRRTMIIEFFYVIFALALLFTEYWYFTVILIAVNLALLAVNTTGKFGRFFIGTSSAICAAILINIVLA